MIKKSWIPYARAIREIMVPVAIEKLEIMVSLPSVENDSSRMTAPG